MSMIIIKNGTIHDAVHREPYQADILIKEGKIAKIALDIEEKEKEVEVYDASGKEIYPGFVEAHSHIGLDGYAIGYEGQDYNEYNDMFTPHLRAIDGIQPMDEGLKIAAKAGVTTVATGPGSSNVLGGTFTAIKTIGKRVDDMIIQPEIAMKCAFGENPKRCYKEKGDSSRMTTAAGLREMLFKAKEYNQKIADAGDDTSKRPEFNMKLEALLPVIRREIPLKAHAHQANDIFTALRIAKEFDVRITLEHVTDGRLIAEELAKEGVPLAVGPLLGQPSKVELKNKSFKTPGVLAKAGCEVSIITDAPVVPQEYLPICAGLAVKEGMDSFEALKAITINPAKHIGVEKRVGSIEIGKDADLVITEGNPFSIESMVVDVFIDGKRID